MGRQTPRTSQKSAPTKDPSGVVVRCVGVPLRPVDSLVPYSKNARTHSPAQVAKIAASLKGFGWTNPILVDADGIIAGHGRLMAAQSLGMPAVPCLDLDGLTKAQRRAYILADNKLALDAGWDDEVLALELSALADDGFDLSLTGFGEAEVERLLEEGVEEDEVPAVPDHPVSVAGDLWILGKHRLLCGSSIVATDVERVLGGVTPHLMVTDPPYGVDYDADWRNVAYPTQTGSAQGRAVGAVRNDGQDDWREAWALFPGDVVYCWHAGQRASSVADSLTASGFEIRAQIVWAKPSLVISRGHYHSQHEPCWYAVRKGATGHWTGDRTQSTLWQIDNKRRNEDADTDHSTQKPIECMRRPILNNSSPGQAVYEPFSGSGTTVIAAESTGRSCHAIELDPGYVDVAVTRWQNFSGQKATLDGDGRTFDDVKAERIK